MASSGIAISHYSNTPRSLFPTSLAPIPFSSKVRGITIPNAHLVWAEVKGRCEHEGTPTMIIIIGSVSIQPDKRELFLAETNKAVRASRAEDGVSRYELVESVEKPNTFLLIEEYADEAVLASHTESQHMQALGAVLGQVLAGPPDVRQYNVSSVQTLEM